MALLLRQGFALQAAGDLELPPARDDEEHCRRRRQTAVTRPTNKKSPGASTSLSSWNANSQAHRHGQGCPPAPAMQQSGGADLTAALHR